MTWLPASFRAPARLELPSGHHLRQIRAGDLDIDYPAVMGSQPRLWSLFGRAWGWPPAGLTREQDLEDLERHVEEMQRNLSFNYAILDAEETQLLGCVYVDPPEGESPDADLADAEVTWWVVDEAVDGPLAACLLPAIRSWLVDAWPFERPRVVGWDLTWEDWSSA